MATSKDDVTNEEAELYDRQIRLWGLEAQSRVRNAKVLLAGFGGFHAEVCKNLVLAGVSVTVQDAETVKEHHLGGAQFFITKKHLGQNRAKASVSKIQELNPFVEVKYVEESLDELDETFFENFQVVSVHGGKLKTQRRISRICHRKGIKCYVSESCGFLSQIYADLDGHEYVKVKQGGTVVSETPIKMSGVSFEELSTSSRWGITNKTLRWGVPPTTLAMIVWKLFTAEETSGASVEAFADKCLRARGFSDERTVRTVAEEAKRAFDSAGVELTAVCAIVGGVLAQDIVKIVSRHNEPINTVFTFDGVTGEGRVTKFFS